MSKDARNNAIFDALLSSAFEEAALRELEELEKRDVPEIEFTTKHKREQRKLYKQMQKNHTTPNWLIITKKIAACLLVVFVLGAVVIAAIPPIRADFAEPMGRVFDNYMALEVDYGYSDMDGKYYILYPGSIINFI